MSHAEIEDFETSVVAVCPWHRYDFDLETGESETGLRACTYAVEIRKDEGSGADMVWMAAPEGGSEWRVIELRPVSEGS
jgi:nitrite reductase/ring-hydroxylating ferredoxin subunit